MEAGEVVVVVKLLNFFASSGCGGSGGVNTFELVCQCSGGEDWWHLPATTFAPAIRHLG